jgi:hypothetical protein
LDSRFSITRKGEGKGGEWMKEEPSAEISKFLALVQREQQFPLLWREKAMNLLKLILQKMEEKSN